MAEKWTGYHSVGLLALIVAIALFGLLIPITQMLLAWLLTLGAMILFAMLAGHGTTGRFWLGWLINGQHRLSLSRLQLALWTVVVLSAFLTAALFNIRGGHAASALKIGIAQELWLAMGISTTSFVTSPLILSQKEKQKTNKTALKKSLMQRELMARDETLTGEKQGQHASGNLSINESPKQAHLYDLIRGEEVGNAHLLDLSRLQNLFFTLILIGAYAASVGSIFARSGVNIAAVQISQLPPLDNSSVALLGISHAGYLTSKAVPKQPEGEDGS